MLRIKQSEWDLLKALTEHLLLRRKEDVSSMWAMLSYQHWNGRCFSWGLGRCISREPVLLSQKIEAFWRLRGKWSWIWMEQMTMNVTCSFLDPSTKMSNHRRSQCWVSNLFIANKFLATEPGWTLIGDAILLWVTSAGLCPFTTVKSNQVVHN